MHPFLAPFGFSFFDLVFDFIHSLAFLFTLIRLKIVSNAYYNLVWISLEWKEMISLVWKKRLFLGITRGRKLGLAKLP
jgi:hypothetical protein